MFKPRNTLVVVEIITQAERKVGQITVPTNNDCYAEAEVIAVGPGTVSASGGVSETFDLKPGDRVWVKHMKKLYAGGQASSIFKLEPEGLPYHDAESNKDFTVFEQSSIVGVFPAKKALLN